AGSRRASGDDGFRLASVGNAAANFADHFLQAVAHGQFVDPGLREIAAQAKQTCATVFWRSELGVPIGATQDDVGNTRKRLSIIDDGGAAPEAHDSRERRPDAGDAAFAFERLHQRRCFADFICARPAVPVDLAVASAAEAVFTKEPFGIGIPDRILPVYRKLAVLTPAV